MTNLDDEYEVSIRITFLPEIKAILKIEKDRFVHIYGSSYKSDPHITLYLNRYTEEGFPKLIAELKELTLRPFSFTLLEPMMMPGHRNHYIVDVSNKELLDELHLKISKVASQYQSKLLRKKDQERLERGIQPGSMPWTPHITLGAVNPANAQPELMDIKNNLRDCLGKQVSVAEVTVFFYVMKKGAEKVDILAEVKIPFNK